MGEQAPPRLRVLVANATRNSGLAVVRDLGRSGFDVIGADDQLLPFGWHSRYSRPYRLFPPPRSPRVREAVLELLKEDRPDVLMPIGTPMVEILARDSLVFEKLTAVLLPSHEAVLAVTDNLRTLEECRTIGIPCPEVLSYNDAECRIDVAASGTESTVVLKPRLDRGSAQGVSYPSDPRTLASDAESCRARYGEFLLQEYIPGGARAMRTLLVLFDRQSRLMAWFSTRKLRQWPVSGGITAMSESTRDERLLRQVLPFFDKWQWRGPAEVEFKVDPRDDVPKLIEINPRFPSYVGFSTRCGLALPRMAVLAAVERWKGDYCPPYSVGVRYINTVAYMKAAVAELWQRRRPRALALDIWSELHRGVTANSFDPTDPVPRLAKLLLETKTAMFADLPWPVGRTGVVRIGLRSAVNHCHY